MAEPQSPLTRAYFAHFLPITTRWGDNDVYGHVNNVIYYAYFDTVVNEYLIANGVLDIEKSPVIGLVVETRCQYFAPIAFPESIDAGLRVVSIGNSSVRYEIGLFRVNQPEAIARGDFVHVYVDRATRRSVRVPDDVRAALLPLQHAGE